MKFFVPAAKDDIKAEQVYSALAQSLKAPITEKRIWKLQWRDREIDMKCEVGKPLPSSYQTGKELVLAIFECENLCKICTLTRGGVKGEPILVGKNSVSSATYFSDNVNN
ncbi:hypothetical protein IQ229_06690 [Nostoc cf. edaphicum LEGE 07299]|uniref:Uncharacterized protein n=1 Tax=Nostoc cf. edaphicum LEGE 07299 TaxID=2777974 RepID=A0ABR9TW49_9NOSO|nr:hypothetical protein [Nostoc edaphicum]MBE9104636.1 hypothetical protein [Nostoc cf. edaphicum LEGE 07299]